MKTKRIPTEVYSRVVGYYRPVNQWNKGKKAEFEDRKEYDVHSLSSINQHKALAV
ncbi:MAG: anaerobic ribonucleoside-triphosphate reductase [Spirochaetota bacterium]